MLSLMLVVSPLLGLGLIAQADQSIHTLPAPGSSQKLLGEIKLTFENLKTTFADIKAVNTQNANKVKKAIQEYKAAQPEDKPAKNAYTNQVVAEYIINVVTNYKLIAARIEEAQQAGAALTDLGSGDGAEIKGFVTDLANEIQPFLEVERQRMESISTMVANNCLFDNPELERHYKNIEVDRTRIREKLDNLTGVIADNGASEIAYDMGLMLNWLKEEVQMNRYDQLVNLARLGTKAFVEGHMAVLQTIKPMLQELWNFGLAQSLKEIEGPPEAKDDIEDWLDADYEVPVMQNPIYAPVYYPKHPGSSSLDPVAIRKANRKANLR